jgi:site-specific DNA-methyltransferase (adenine-specific)
MTAYMPQSLTDEWATPQDLFDELNREFGFTLDVCATPENAKCADYFTKEQNALDQVWGGGLLDEPTLRACHKRLDGESVGSV